MADMRHQIPITATDVLAALEASKWDVKAAAQALGISDRTLYRRMREFDIRSQLRYVREAA